LMISNRALGYNMRYQLDSFVINIRLTSAYTGVTAFILKWTQQNR